MEDWVVTVLLEVLTVVSDFGAALAGAANPATARTPVSKNVAAIFFIRWSFQTIERELALRASLYGQIINIKAK
ncbi:hypothetical protein [Arthrobacter sp. Y81]|uniref:hypothetical protein n=1 Tax=Arthrobacter sp. Y81 TaxID=2058897 RepID=UPI000CE35DB8|nr:hypothetical protein [Arthrobacter sp. Y81]